MKKLMLYFGLIVISFLSMSQRKIPCYNKMYQILDSIVIANNGIEYFKENKDSIAIAFIIKIDSVGSLLEYRVDEYHGLDEQTLDRIEKDFSKIPLTCFYYKPSIEFEKGVISLSIPYIAGNE